VTGVIHSGKRKREKGKGWKGRKRIRVLKRTTN
jgi:hypothetical protein